MAAEATVASPAPCGGRARLRAAVLRLGARLGWSARDVAAFAEALTDRPWARLESAELEVVRDEYLALLRVIAAKAARRAHAGGEHVAGA
jgi:hypothetical protein